MNKILVIGDSCKDIFIYGDCYRLNPEAPTPVLSETRRIEYSGMAANVLKNIKALGLEADLLTHKEKIIKTRYVDQTSNYILLRIDNDNSVSSLTNIESIKFSEYDLVVISDYNKGFLSEEIIDYILLNSKLSFIDSKKPIGSWIKNASFIKINKAEYLNPLNDWNLISNELEQKMLVTLGDKGVKFQNRLYAPPTEIFVRDVTGAGDSFLASLSAHFLLYKDIKKAIEFANLCAGQVVSKRGLAMPDEKLL